MMEWPEFLTLAGEVAAGLAARRGETWTVEPAAEAFGTWPYAELAGPASARLRVEYGAGKITVTGLLPDGTLVNPRERRTHRMTLTASVSAGRGAGAVVTAADTRVLRSGYLDVLPGKVAEHAARIAREAARARWLARAAALFGMDPPVNGRPLNLGKYAAGHGEVSNWSQDVPPRLSLTLNGVPAEVALRMLAVLAEASLGGCCHRYGPGHHPGLAIAGCLREHSERGETPSAARVAGLLLEHGADDGEAQASVREARDSPYRVAMILRGGRVLAVVSWDTGRYGEFTVELVHTAAGGA